jgi:hypothetical protein
MLIWFTIPLGIGIMAAVMATIRRRTSSVTALHLDR